MNELSELSETNLFYQHRCGDWWIMRAKKCDKGWFLSDMKCRDSHIEFQATNPMKLVRYSSPELAADAIYGYEKGAA